MKLYNAFPLLFSQAKSAFASSDLDVGLLRNQKHTLHMLNACKNGLQITDAVEEEKLEEIQNGCHYLSFVARFQFPVNAKLSQNAKLAF